MAQATQPCLTQNVREMLRLHEGILLEIKGLITGLDVQKQPKHGRWQSIETLEGVIVEKATNAVRRSLDIPWFGRFKQHTKSTAPREAADVAKVFERTVWFLDLIRVEHHTPT